MSFVLRPAASIASRAQHFVTIAKRPSLPGTGRRELIEMICPTGRAEYFYAEDWTLDSALIALEKLDCWRKDLLA